MKKTYCDACGCEVKEHLMSYDPLMHIVAHIDRATVNGYVDRDSNPISGRSEHFDLCLSCYNAVHFQAYKVIKTIQEVQEQKKAIE